MEKPMYGFFNRKIYWLATAGTVILLTGVGFVISYFSSSSNQLNAQYESQINALSLNAILANGELTKYAEHTSHPLFLEYCAACHGEKGVGHETTEGFFAPVLNDNDWLFEGKIDGIYGAIANGSQGVMPAYRKTLSKREIESVSKYVKALSEGHGDNEPVGKKVFENADCIACHGEDAKGSKTIGAVNLTDKIWRFDGTLNGIKRTISFGVNSGDTKDRMSMMPKFADTGKLSNVEIKKLAIYVYKLSERHDE